MSDGEDAAQRQSPTNSAPGLVAPVDESTMEDIIDKLKILKYETAFCPLVKPPFRPLNRYYFLGPSSIDNANTQFFYFTSLCSWLMGLCGHAFEPPGQFDDPNATATTILAELRAMRVSAPNLAPNRIKLGSGEAVLTVLMALVDQALTSKGFQFRPIDYSAMEQYDEQADVAELSDGDEADAVEDNAVIDSDGDDELYVRATGEKDVRDEDAVPISSTINADEWNLEVERVGPLLQVRGDHSHDWRSRIESATVLFKAVEKMYPEVKQMLGKLTTDMEKSRDKIQKREQTLAQQFSDQVEDYRVKLRELNSSRDSAALENQSVQQLTAELSQISELLDQTKRDIEDRETKISDTTPLMQVKEAVGKVSAEIKQMTLRIGVLQHNVLHYVLKQTKAKRETPAYDEEDLLDSYDDVVNNY